MGKGPILLKIMKPYGAASEPRSTPVKNKQAKKSMNLCQKGIRQKEMINPCQKEIRQ
jgi:hypothetical protein